MSKSEHYLEQLADGLASQDYAIIDNFLSMEEVSNILTVFEIHQQHDRFKRAGIGKDDKYQRDESIRGDYIKWIERSSAMPPVLTFLDKIDELKDYLNRTCFLGIRDYETHFTIYPPGSFYKKHVDQFRTDGARKISFICYLNPNWKPNDGGELRIHHGHGHFDVEPIAGRLACFRSEIVEHEVLKSYNHRYSLTGWMLNMPIGLEFVADM